MIFASSNSAPPPQAVGNARRGYRASSIPVRVLTILLLSLLASIVFEWIGMVFVWPELGVQHSERMLALELQYLNKDFQQAVYGTTPAVAVSWLSTRGYYYLFQWTHLESIFAFIGSMVGLSEFIQAMFTTAKTFLVRLGVLTFSMPAFLLFAIVGVATGFTLRDIRRWSAGREYGGVYHRAKWFIPRILWLAWIVYLALPFSLHPNLIILPCAILLGINLLILSASFKKYL